MNKKYRIIIVLLIIVSASVAYAAKKLATHVSSSSPSSAITYTTPASMQASTSTVTPQTNVSIQPRKSPSPLKVGAVTWHQANFINKQVFLVGYVLKIEKGYVIFSDEATGAITAHDLPVNGIGSDALMFKQKYMFKGTFLDKGLIASNKSKYHLELSEAPQLVSTL